jgi:hypothetical protein
MELIRYITGNITSDIEASKSAQEETAGDKGIWETIKDVLGLFKELFYMTISFIVGTIKILANLIGILRESF